MKLNPPASSSDLEVARQIARRLHQNRRRDDPAAASWSSDEAPARPRLTPPPLPPRPAPAEPADAEPPEPFEPPRAQVKSASHSPALAQAREAAPVLPPPALALAHAPEPPEESFDPSPPEPSFDLPEAPPFERPSWSESAAEESEASAFEPGDPGPAPLEDLTDPTEPPPDAAEEQPPEEPAMPDVDIDVDEPGLSPEEMVGEAAETELDDVESSPLDQLTEPEDSPFGDELLDAPAVAEEPAPPAWDDIVETCRGLAIAGGAMLIDPAGQVFATRGDWPAPGPDAIAGKLVAMMAKTLKDAPTRSISAPLMGMHLTAWRVPLSEGLVTAAFIGAAPVRAEARPAIDAEILSGVGS